MDINLFVDAMQAVGLNPIIIDENTKLERNETVSDLCEECEEELATTSCPDCDMQLCEYCMDDHECYE